MNVKNMVYAFAFILSVGMVIYLGASEGDEKIEMDQEGQHEITGKITDSETYISAENVTFQILSLNDGRIYVITRSDDDLIFTVGDEVSLDVQDDWERLEGERFYERYPGAITAINARLISIPLIIEGQPWKLELE